MKKLAKKGGLSSFSQKILIFVFLGVLFYGTHIYVMNEERTNLSFGEERSVQEILTVWDDVGEVYIPGEDELLDINSATEEELMLLPNIGEALAKRILEYREETDGFTSILELEEVAGIGEKTLASISDYIYVEIF